MKFIEMRLGRFGFGRELACRTIDESWQFTGSSVRRRRRRCSFVTDAPFRQRIDIDFERTDVKSRFNWINRAAIHYLNKTAFWNLAQYK
jgi:hypothetical protein